MYLSVTVSCWLHLKHKRTLVAFRYRMLKLHGWKVLSTITLLQGPPIYPRISLLTSHRGGGEGGVHRTSAKKCEFPELFSVTFLLEQSRADRSGWSWKPARNLVKGNEAWESLSTTCLLPLCQRVAEGWGGGGSLLLLHMSKLTQMPWKVLKSKVACGW